jgi:hypothetical protein
MSLLPLKCCELGNMPLLLFSLWDLHLSLFKSLLVHHVVCSNERRVIGKGGFVHLV